MDDLVRELPSHARVLDLGAGAGSFNYSSTAAQVIALDLAFPAHCQPSLGRLTADSGAIPLRSGCIDVVVCNHTLEHFENLGQAVREIDRVMRRGAFLWAAVPDGHCFDDRLYRLVFKGGGHVNQFSLASFIQAVEAGTGLRARRCKELFTGFVYLNPPLPERLQYYPRRARILGWMPARLLEVGLRVLNYSVRRIDRLLGSRLSRYGWGVIFERVQEGEPGSETAQIERLPSDFNVCFSCGAGHPTAALASRQERFLFWKVYRCSCGKRNFFFDTKPH